MCGISGIISDRAVNLHRNLKSMVAAQHHRGPDETGFFSNEKCLFGHNRLSIIDINCGQQPMSSASGRYTIVFNGEIYGYKKIKKNLDYNFKTNSDTEVILALYEKYGHDLPKHLPGMFAFAIWDNQEKSLFIARDRVGEKPLYYCKANTGSSTFLFASEVPTLIASNLVSTSINQESIDMQGVTK